MVLVSFYHSNVTERVPCNGFSVYI